MSGNPEVVVYGNPWLPWDSGGGTGSGGSGGSTSGPNYTDSENADGTGTFVGAIGRTTPTDESEISIDIMIFRTPTASEIQAIANFRDAVSQATNAIESINDAARVQVSPGRFVTGAELKAIWAKMDFVIHDTGTNLGGGTTTGIAGDFASDQPTQYTLGYLDSMDDFPGGSLFAMLHELGHMTQAGEDLWAAAYQDGHVDPTEMAANQRLANNVAFAVANAGGLPIYIDPFFGQDPGAVLM